MLLVSAGLMVRTVASLFDQDAGFESAAILTARLTLPAQSYPDATDRVQFFDGLVERLEGLPGVEAVGLTSALPLTGRGDTGTFQIEGRDWENGDGPSIGKRSASAGYFRALGIPVLAGREFTLHDRADATPVTVISDSVGRRFFANEDPLGKRINLDWWDSEFLEIVGVVGDVKQSTLDEDITIAAYRPQAQIAATDATIAIKATGDPYHLVAAARSAVREADPNQPIYEVISLDDLVRGSVARQSALAALLLGLSIIAMAISCIGVYAVTVQAVGHRGQEIGIRIALGARGGDVFRSVMVTESQVIGVGILFGLFGVVATTRWLEAQLFGVTPLDLPTLFASAAALGCVALFAIMVPALKASRTDPARSLRSQ